MSTLPPTLTATVKRLAAAAARSLFIVFTAATGYVSAGIIYLRLIGGDASSAHDRAMAVFFAAIGVVSGAITGLLVIRLASYLKTRDIEAESDTAAG